MRLHKPSPAMSIALLALFVALGGSSYAAITLSKDSVKARQIAKDAVRASEIKANAVRGAEVKDGSLKAGDFAAGQLPQGEPGPPGAPADTSTLVKRVAESGDTMTGEVATRFAAGQTFDMVSDSWPSRLPNGTPTPTLDIVDGSGPTAECPGIGQAPPGRLCVYVYNHQNFDPSWQVFGGGATAATREHGFTFEVEITSDASPGYMIASWAYQVP